MIEETAKSGRPRVRVAIVDDHPMVREGLIALIARQPDLAVCGEADDVVSGFHLIEDRRPDIAIVDISLKSGNGLDLIRRIKEELPEVKALVVSMFDEELFAERAFRAGAVGFINKGEGAARIISAIADAAAGRLQISDKVSARILRRSSKPANSAEEPAISGLSDRELEIFKLIGEGLATSEIATRLHRSVKTIETHRQRIKTKLGLETSGALSREALHWLLEQK
jgi:DNA-binding NarL/FixJ family response regulator